MTALLKVLISKFIYVLNKVTLIDCNKLKVDINNHEAQMNTFQANEHVEIFMAKRISQN